MNQLTNNRVTCGRNEVEFFVNTIDPHRGWVLHFLDAYNLRMYMLIDRTTVNLKKKIDQSRFKRRTWRSPTHKDHFSKTLY